MSEQKVSELRQPSGAQKQARNLRHRNGVGKEDTRAVTRFTPIRCRRADATALLASGVQRKNVQ
jgi:hypothetical protein